MLEFCTSCGFMGFGGVDSEYERLNNAIVRASSKGAAWAKLAEDWQDEAVEEHAWKMSIPPLWNSVMKAYWSRYAELYNKENDQRPFTNPYDVAPSVVGGLKDMYAPAAQVTEQAKKAVTDTVAQLKKKAVDELKKVAEEVGKVAGKSSAKGAEEEAMNWVVALGSLAVLGAVGYYLVKSPARGGSLGSAYRSRRRKLRYLRKQRAK